MTTLQDTNLGPDVRSDDGRTFVALTDHLHPGDLAVIDADSTSLLAQVRASRTGAHLTIEGGIDVPVPTALTDAGAGPQTTRTSSR